MITGHLSHTMALIYELWDCVGKWKSVWICGAAQQNLKKNVNTMIKQTSKWLLSTGSHISIQSDWQTFYFIRNYSSMAAPLTVLTSGKRTFLWSPVCFLHTPSQLITNGCHMRELVSWEGYCPEERSWVTTRHIPHPMIVAPEGLFTQSPRLLKLWTMTNSLPDRCCTNAARSSTLFSAWLPVTDPACT